MAKAVPFLEEARKKAGKNVSWMTNFKPLEAFWQEKVMRMVGRQKKAPLHYSGERPSQKPI